MENIKTEQKVKIELYNDHFENAKRYGIPKAQLIVADIPYNLGNNAYATTLCGMRVGIIRTEKANLQERVFLTPITILR